MIAYRLHFEAINLSAIDLARQRPARRAEVLQLVVLDDGARGDIRTKRAYGGGTLYDIGVYCINAARNLFRAEPTEVSAVSVNSGLATLAEIDETTGCDAAVRRRARGDVRHQLQCRPTSRRTASSAPRASSTPIRRTSTPKGSNTD